MEGLEVASLPLRILAVFKLLTVEPAIFIQVNLRKQTTVLQKLSNILFPTPDLHMGFAERHKPGFDHNQGGETKEVEKNEPVSGLP